jgi:hypothetical protein
MRTDRFELAMRIIVVDPVPGLSMALQRGQAAKAVLTPPAILSDAAITFEFEVIVDGVLPNGDPRLLGPFVQGPATARFVYLPIGRYAGQPDSEWGGRVKVPLEGLGWTKIETRPLGERLEARIKGRSPKGGPAMASTALLPPGWTWRP